MYIRIAFSIELRLRVSNVRRLKIYNVKCIINCLIHNLQGKRARFFFVISISNMTIAMILLQVSST